MAPRVFFSFHYERDIWRANQVRKSWVVRGGQEEGRFVDASLWEEAKTRGDAAIQRLIDEGLERSDATVVLIGQETAQRRWVRYEIEQSWLRDNAIIGVHINRLRHSDGQWHPRGPNPFFKVSYDGNKTLGKIVPLYDWQQDSGYDNLIEWLEEAPCLSDFEERELSWTEIALGGVAVAGLAYLLYKLGANRQNPPPPPPW